MSVTDSIERIHALLALYRESHYDVELPGGGTVTLRIGANAAPEIARWIGATQTAGYLTACNPRSQSLTQSENEQRLDGLRQQVRERGGEYLEGAGYMPGEKWREPSLLVRGVGEGALDALAREHEQNGILIVPARGPVVLRIYRPDWRSALGSDGGVEWAAGTG
jgi:hypothetical protein